MKARLALLPGDGIGPEVVHQARLALVAVARRFSHEFEVEEHPIGGAALDAGGKPLPSRTMRACRAADAILLGAVGGPQWAQSVRGEQPEDGLFGLRVGLGLFANLRPVSANPHIMDACPLKRERVEGADILVVRELLGGLYAGQKRLETTPEGLLATDSSSYLECEIDRVARIAFREATKRRGRVTSVDKANALETSRLWRRVVTRVGEEHTDVVLEHQLVDSCALRLVSEPRSFDVILTENMFGDILSDEAAVIVGSLGMLPSASIGESSRGLYEPVHGSAPELAGRGVANPIGTILSAALLLRHSLGLHAEAAALEQAVEGCLRDGVKTRDLGGSQSTQTVGAAIIARL